MIVEDLIKELQKLDPKAEVIIEDYDYNFNCEIHKIDYNNGYCKIIVDEVYE